MSIIVKASKSLYVKKKGAPVYTDVLSVSGMQKYMANLEISPVITRALKKKEREIGVTIEKIAKKFCLNVTELKQNLCSSNSSAANKEGDADLKASYDMISWEKVVVHYITGQGWYFLRDRK